ncbi:histidine--tRNA ligase, cytoplasmic-like isoform X2 [Curcuma longa]|uniref:histidine--tRNA ligase, cytoplasmic-like isoform X2 n=1 Tax=Curcuma longa TaxID=136217 RepID=UPI003D9DDBDC
MASPLANSTVTVGGKGSSLSPSAVYAVSHGESSVSIDPAALEKLSQSKRPPPMGSTQDGPSTPLSLTAEESRAALVVLLNKLVLSDAAVRPGLPSLIVDTLNLASGLERLDFCSASGFWNSIAMLNVRNLDEIQVGREELGIFETSCAASVGVCAILDCCASALVKVVDAVAALSCEAARADVSALDLFGSGDVFSMKDETDVASDMKTLLFGSKLVGQNDSSPFSEIPTVNGSFREAVRLFHGRTRVELNSSVKVKKSIVIANHGKEKAFIASVLPLAMSIQSLCESSIGRAKSSINIISDSGLHSRVAEVFEKACPNLDDLRDQFHSVTEKAASGSNSAHVLHSVYDFLVKFRDVLAWEAVLALFSLEIDDSIERVQVDSSKDNKPNGDFVKGEKKNDKKKKKNLGKGTSTIRKLLRGSALCSSELSAENVSVLVDWASDLSKYFDPMDARLDNLLTRVKEVVESNEVRRLPKIPKGTRDFGKEQMAIRERAFSIITGVFKMHGAVALDTPVFELRETLMGKYGEDSKLIYDLADQGGELCSLRYDLTVPFARYLAMNNINALKRYQIAKVYRRDNPSKGRYREFYQCDFDIAGQYETMEPDFEVIKVLTELLDQLDIGSYEIKLNHRKLLDGMLEICGVSSEKFRTVCSSIDKLDKQPFEQIKKELVEEKGLSTEIADKIGTFVKRRGPALEILSELKEEGSQFLENTGSVVALNELEILFKALEKANCLNRVVFDLSLARGLDYYTGVIYEAVFKGATQQGGDTIIW